MLSYVFTACIAQINEPGFIEIEVDHPLREGVWIVLENSDGGDIWKAFTRDRRHDDWQMMMHGLDDLPFTPAP